MMMKNYCGSIVLKFNFEDYLNNYVTHMIDPNHKQE
jgi:hypothetical protein